jgi:hypothetical protein
VEAPTCDLGTVQTRYAGPWCEKERRKAVRREPAELDYATPTTLPAKTLCRLPNQMQADRADGTTTAPMVEQ